MFGSRSNKAVAVALIESGSAAVAIMTTGANSDVLSHVREDLSLEDRTKDALRKGVIQALASAGEKARAESLKSGGSAISTCYCIVGAPWTRSFAGSARSRFERPTAITDSLVGDLAKQALDAQKDVERANLLEANVSRILLNGYPTADPAGKHASTLEIFTLVSDCDADIKAEASEAIAKLFPGVTIVWRSNARANLNAAKQLDPVENGLIVEIGNEATDLVSMRKGVFDQRVVIEQGVRHVLGAFAKGKPAAETMSLLELIEKDECDDAACEELRQSIAKAEPELVHVFGEALAKLASPRKLSDDILVIAPPALAPWLARFFARIDFTQFTATAKPFNVVSFSATGLSGVPHGDHSFETDPGFAIACSLVNMEVSS